MSSYSAPVPAAPNSSPTTSPTDECCPYQRIHIQERAVLGPYKTCESCDRFLGFVEPEPGTAAYEKRKASLLEPVTVQVYDPGLSTQPAALEPAAAPIPSRPIPKLSISEATPPPFHQRRPRSRNQQARYHPYAYVDQWQHTYTPIETSKSITWSHLPLTSRTHHRSHRPPPPPPARQPQVNRSISWDIHPPPAATPMEPRPNAQFSAGMPVDLGRRATGMEDEAYHGHGRMLDPRFLHPEWEAALSRQQLSRRREMNTQHLQQQQQQYLAQQSYNRGQPDGPNIGPAYYMPSRSRSSHHSQQSPNTANWAAFNQNKRLSNDSSTMDIDPRLQSHTPIQQPRATRQHSLRSPAPPSLMGREDMDMTTASEIPASMSDHSRFRPHTPNKGHKQRQGQNEVIVLDDGGNDDGKGNTLPAPYCPCGLPARCVMLGGEVEGKGVWKWVCGGGRCGYFMDV